MRYCLEPTTYHQWVFAKSSNQLFRQLHSAGLWLSSADAKICLVNGQRLLNSYAALAKLCITMRLYKLKPKAHMMCHWVDQFKASQVLNPILVGANWREESAMGRRLITLTCHALGR